jgi:hypothetical protein
MSTLVAPAVLRPAPRFQYWREVRLAFWSLIALGLVAITLSPWASGFADDATRTGTDLQLYAAEVEQLRAGGNYYDIAARELPARGFPTRSVFNWRTPLPFTLIAAVPEFVSRGLLLLVALGTVWLILPMWYQHSRGLGVASGCFFMWGAAQPIFLKQALLLPEVWSGLFLGLSLAAYARERRALGITAGLAALLLRELAAPYAVLCTLWAIRQRRWHEALCWMIGGCLYLMFYTWHIEQVLWRITPNAIAHTQSWLAFGGAAFVISLVQMNVWLLVLPQWVSALVLTMTAKIWSRPQTDWERRLALTGAMYLLLFGLIGLPFNQYWGSLLAPLIAITLGFIPVRNKPSLPSPSLVT